MPNQQNQNKKTRQQILEAISHHQQATVDDINFYIQERFQNFVTAVTVRHHLRILEENKLITVNVISNAKPGRPKHMYRLTEKAAEVLPRNYQQLADVLLQHISTTNLSQVNVIFEGVGELLAGGITFQNGSWENRLEAVVQHLNKQGYVASYQPHQEGYILHTDNCPYHEIAQQNEHLCQIDMYYIARLLGVVPRRVSAMVADGSERCSYLIPLI